MGAVVITLMLLLAGILVLGMVGLGARWLDTRQERLAYRKRRVHQLVRMQDELESLVIHTLTVDPNDITANQVATILRDSRVKELKGR